MIPRVGRAPILRTLPLALALVVAACDGGGGGGLGTPRTGATAGPNATSGTVDRPEGEPNVISGTVTTEAGQPIADARLRIVGYTGGSGLGMEIETVISGPDGTYRYDVPRGLYQVLGTAAIDFDGQTYVFDLDPVDGACEQVLSDAGIVEDFVLHLQGLKPCIEGAHPDNHGYYHGAAIQLSNGTTLAPHEVIEYTLEPTTPLADGSTGTTLTMERTVAAHSTSAGPIDDTWLLYDIPLARYAVSAAVITPGGRQPLLISSGTEGPAASVEIVFDARLVVGTPDVGYSGLTPSIQIHDGTAAR